VLIPGLPVCACPGTILRAGKASQLLPCSQLLIAHCPIGFRIL